MSAPTAHPPRQIGPYRVLHSIARGGSGHVFEVEDPATGEHLALKMLMSPGASLARFHREYEAMIRLNHPNIIRVYHFGVHEQMPWQTMELVTGTPVQPYIMRKGRPGDPGRVEEVIRLGHDIATALYHIHRRGLIHRDLKSANLLVLPDGRIKLIDFGSVKVLDGERITRKRDFVGTFAYASPEQLQGGNVDGRSDLYSLGVLLYRLATGRRPFEHADPMTLARMHLHDAPTPPQEMVPGIPDALQELILELLAKKVDDRPRSGKVVARTLERMAGRPLLLPGTLELEDTADRLVGREGQQQALRAFLDAEEPGGLVILEGLEGSGRHTALGALASDARGEGHLVYRCVLSPGNDLVSVTLALRQVYEALPAPDDPAIQRARVLLDSIAEGWDVRSPRRRSALQQAGTILLRATATQLDRRVLFILEALHHASPVILEWLDAVKRAVRRTETPVQFAAGVDPAQDRAAVPVRERFADDLWIRLPTLDIHQTGLLVGALLHRRPPPPTVASRIHAAAGGLPVYIEGVVKALVEEGLLTEQDRDPNRIEWSRQQDRPIPVPRLARDRVLDHLNGLAAPHRRALESLAFLDPAATVRDLAVGVSWTPAELMPVLEDLQDEGWLEPGPLDGDAPVSWRQALAREVVRSECRPDRASVLRRLLAGAAASARRTPAQVELLLSVGRVDGALDSALVQAREHLDAGRPATALRILNPVVARVHGARIADRGRLARLFLLHAEALRDVRPMDPELNRSLKRAESLGTGDAFRAELAMVRAGLQRRIGHLQNFRQHLGEAWTHAQHAENEPTLSVSIAIELGMSHLRAGQGRYASRWFHQAVRIAQEVDQPRLLATAEAGLSHLRYARGDLTSAEVAAIASIELFERADDHVGLALALPVWANVLRQQGRFSEAIARITRSLPRFRQQENPTPYVKLLVALAWLELELCRLGRAQECIDELAATVGPGEHLVLRLEAKLAAGRILLASDQLREAAGKLSEVASVGANAGLVLVTEHARSLLAEALWHGGKQDEARVLFRKCMRRARDVGDVPLLLDVCRSRGRVTAAQANPDALYQPVREVLANEPAEVTRMEWHLATAAHVAAAGQDAERAWKRARLLLRRLARGLTDVDRSALRVHPWARQIRSALDEGDPLEGV